MVPPAVTAVYVIELAGEDDGFAAAEAEAAGEGVSVAAPGLATAEALDQEQFVHLAYSRRASEVIGRAPASIDAAKEVLEETERAVRDGTVAVKARDVRGTAEIDTQAAERVLGAVLVEAGMPVDLDSPDHVLVALFAADSAYLGWQVAESVRDYGDRAPTDRPFFQPGSMDPLLARAVVNLADVAPGDRVLDPMCGTGGLLIEAALVGGRPIGFDAQSKMVHGTNENLKAVADEVPSLGLADATALPVGDASAEAVVFDAPYGRQSRIETHTLGALVAGALAEAKRVGEQGVLVADREYRTEAEAAGWSVEAVHQRPVHQSLTRYVHVLS